MRISKEEIGCELNIGDNLLWEEIIKMDSSISRDKYILGFSTENHISLLDPEVVRGVIFDKLPVEVYLGFNEAYSRDEDIHDTYDGEWIDIATISTMKYMDNTSQSYFIELSNFVEEVLVAKYMKCVKQMEEKTEVVSTLFLKVDDFPFLGSFSEYEEQSLRGIPADYIEERVNEWIEEQRDDGTSGKVIAQMEELLVTISLCSKKNKVEWCIIEFAE